MNEADTTAIIASRLYTPKEASAFVPSVFTGKRLYPRTPKRWLREGRLQVEPRDSGGRRYWFERGAELIRFLGAAPPDVQSAEERQKKQEVVRRELGLKHGI
jgi:hypothetical protein